jgi:hypothetical protein
VRALTVTGPCGLAWLRAGAAGGATPTTTAPHPFANYAFASELGSGIYELSGRTVTVYQLQPGHRLPSADGRRGAVGLASGDRRAVLKST